MVSLRRVRRLRASALGRYRKDVAASRIRWRVSGRTCWAGSPRSTRDAVDGSTPRGSSDVLQAGHAAVAVAWLGAYFERWPPHHASLGADVRSLRCPCPAPRRVRPGCLAPGHPRDGALGQACRSNRGMAFCTRTLAQLGVLDRGDRVTGMELRVLEDVGDGVDGSDHSLLRFERREHVLVDHAGSIQVPM